MLLLGSILEVKYTSGYISLVKNLAPRSGGGLWPPVGLIVKFRIRCKILSLKQRLFFKLLCTFVFIYAIFTSPLKPFQKFRAFFFARVRPVKCCTDGVQLCKLGIVIRVEKLKLVDRVQKSCFGIEFSGAPLCAVK